MATNPYFGTYGRFVAPLNEQGIALMSADSLIGDELTCTFATVEGKTKCVLANRFGGEIGVLEPEASHSVQLARAREWCVHILLASVFQTQQGLDRGDGGNEQAKHGRAQHWGEVVILAYPQSKADVFDVFCAGIARMLGEGVRPEVDLQQSAVEQIIESGGTWRPSGRRALPEKPGSVLIKSQISLNEKMVEGARKRNPGCMLAGWAFIAGLVFVALYLGKLLLGF